jgi:hypothetical protein
MEAKILLEPESLLKLSKENTVRFEKKPYTKPVLTKYGAVAELTNGHQYSCVDHGDWRRHKFPGHCQ